jgi:hypothetical protein
MVDINQLSVIMQASNFSDNRIDYKYGWIRHKFILTKDDNEIYSLENSSIDEMFIGLLLKSFGLIEVMLNTSNDIADDHISFPVTSDKSYNAQNNVPSYKNFKNLLISIVNSGNALRFKFCVCGYGTIVWRDGDFKHSFFAGSWTSFVYYLFQVFKINEIL